MYKTILFPTILNAAGGALRRRTLFKTELEEYISGFIKEKKRSPAILHQEGCMGFMISEFPLQFHGEWKRNLQLSFNFAQFARTQYKLANGRTYVRSDNHVTKFVF